MLGKRPHQIQRTTSMAQLRVPPSARPRNPARDFIQKVRKPADAHPKVHQETLRLEVEPPHVASMHAEALPSMVPAHMPDHLKACGPLPSTPAWMPPPLLTKHLMSESFMDACYSCKKPLGHGRDIFMYRGDAAFCSEDCRLRQIAYDERRQKCSVARNVSYVGTSKTATTTASSGAF